ncbi:MAG: phosphoglycerate kinase [candidate division Zixibacteria bacterium RBG_16_43_9]|nr:MAG: phosphoglycerate kinase [candidate division Zixibacteria bacterium RBG_16_43_9]
MNKLTIDDLKLKDKRVLVRVDFNVPLNEKKEVADDTRIVESLPTIKKILGEGGKAILMSHLGRPKGKDPNLNLALVAKKLEKLLGKPVKFVSDCIGPMVEKAVSELKPGECLLLENLRFYPQEEKNDPEFAKSLAKLGDVYVNDAFGTAHRAHASTEGVTKYFKECAAGYLMQKELKYLSMALSQPKRPFVAILGGSKISGKIDVIKNLMDKVDTLLIGGGMAFTFYKALGKEVGTSLVEVDKIELAKEILQEADKKKIDLELPLDFVIAPEATEDATTKVVDKDNIPAGWKGLDIGPKTEELFKQKIRKANTIVWNGPMGVFEVEKFARGTMEVAKELAEVTRKNAVTIVGGGDSVAALVKANLEKKMTHVSTGGGASLEFLEGKTLPGIAALTDKK